MSALHHNGMWELVTLPYGKTTVGCHGMFTVKYHPHGSVEHYKACLATEGYTQNTWYKETFPPVARISFVRLRISLAAILGCSFVSVGCQR